MIFNRKGNGRSKSLLSYFTASPLTSSGSFICGSSSSDVTEGSASDDDGLVIEALNQLDDL